MEELYTETMIKTFNKVIKPIKNHQPSLRFSSTPTELDSWKDGYYAACEFFMNTLYGSDWRTVLKEN